MARDHAKMSDDRNPLAGHRLNDERAGRAIHRAGAQFQGAWKPTRMACSGEARPCGVEPERKLFGAAATSRGKRAWASAESKGQLIKSTPAASAAAASSGDFT